MSNSDLIDRLRIDSRPDASDPPRRWWLWALLVVAAVTAAGVWFWSARAGVTEVRVVGVERIEAAPTAARASVLDASGYVVARRQATVAAEVTGKLVEVNVEEGQSVEGGEVLAQIDDATDRAQLALAEARLNAARGALAETEAQLANARRTLQRQIALRDRDLTSEANMDLARTEVDALTARLANQQEQVQVARREVELQRRRIEQLTIRAPFSGIVIARAAQAGEMVSPVSAGGGFTRTGICTIVDMDSLEIEVDVNEAYIDRVASGQPVVARLDAYPEWEIPARVKAVVPAADRQKATVRVRVEFVDLDPRILPEMGISVRFLAEQDEPAPDAGAAARVLPMVPASTVFRRDGRDYVYLVRDEQVELRAVRLGAENGVGGERRVIISAGLSGGEVLVADAAEVSLDDGAPVRVIRD
ncbi:MAG: efflux RND transporter periplasmic adaptor subunit [Wenzhouxiangellaceae bacterium]